MKSYVRPGTTQRGFTLIELVVVIVILGILAAFAVPKFMGLEKQARISSVSALEGTLRSASAMAYGIALATGQTGNTGTITVNGTPVALAFGYPTTASVGSLLDPSVLTTTSQANKFTNTTGTFTLNGAPTPANCRIQYRAATSATRPPVIGPPVTTGC